MWQMYFLKPEVHLKLLMLYLLCCFKISLTNYSVSTLMGLCVIWFLADILGKKLALLQELDLVAILRISYWARF